MIEKLKKMPPGVKVAVLFLIACFVALCYMSPVVALALGLGAGVACSFIRISHYLENGN